MVTGLLQLGPGLTPAGPQVLRQHQLPRSTPQLWSAWKAKVRLPPAGQMPPLQCLWAECSRVEGCRAGRARPTLEPQRPSLPPLQAPTYALKVPPCALKNLLAKDPNGELSSQGQGPQGGGVGTEARGWAGSGAPGRGWD